MISKIFGISIMVLLVGIVGGSFFLNSAGVGREGCEESTLPLSGGLRGATLTFEKGYGVFVETPDNLCSGSLNSILNQIMFPDAMPDSRIKAGAKFVLEDFIGRKRYGMSTFEGSSKGVYLILRGEDKNLYRFNVCTADPNTVSYYEDGIKKYLDCKSYREIEMNFLYGTGNSEEYKGSSLNPAFQINTP